MDAPFETESDIELARVFDDACYDKLKEGLVEYGTDAWKQDELLADLQEELVDIANYAKMMWIKVSRVRRQLREEGLPSV